MTVWRPDGSGGSGGDYSTDVDTFLAADDTNKMRSALKLESATLVIAGFIEAGTTRVFAEAGTTTAFSGEVSGNNSEFESIAHFRNSSNINTEINQISVEGYHGGGTPGGGVLTLHHNDTTTPDDGVIVFVNQSGQRAKRSYSVPEIPLEWAGAKQAPHDSTAAFHRAIAVGGQITIPAGTFACNIVCDRNFTFEGQGSSKTFLLPFDFSQPIFKYKKRGVPLWAYHAECKNLAFKGVRGEATSYTRQGIGFSMGEPGPLLADSGDHSVINVKFWGVRFENLHIGLLCPAGNLGVELYSCSFQRNYYGMQVFSSRNGVSQHAGNKHIYAGYFALNVVALYIDDGGQGMSFNVRDTIVEQNAIAVYAKMISTVAPLTFRSTHFEGNGRASLWSTIKGVSSPFQAPVNIDVLNGNSFVTESLEPRSFYFRGESTQVTFKEGRVQDVVLDGADITIESENSYFYSDLNLSYTFIGEGHQISLSRPILFQDFPNDPRVLVKDVHRPVKVSMGETVRARSRWCHVGHRAQTTPVCTDKLLAGLPLNVATDLTGAPNVSGVLVSDGLLKTQCNEYSGTFVAGDYTALDGSTINTGTNGGWHVISGAIKQTTGAIELHIWDRANTRVVTNIRLPADSEWYTFVAIARSVDNASYWVDISAIESGPTTFRLADFQILRFPERVKAESFIESNLYTE